jgi:hypothetical protein
MTGKGETDLGKLLKTMQPVLVEGAFVFCTINKPDMELLHLKPLGMFYEAEGLTLILPAGQETGLTASGKYSLITLNVHSSLEAVGFLAVIAARLAEQGISVNAVSAYYHDHLFVPIERAQDALKILQSMAQV